LLPAQRNILPAIPLCAALSEALAKDCRDDLTEKHTLLADHVLPSTPVHLHTAPGRKAGSYIYNTAFGECSGFSTEFQLLTGW